jgi:hypothetical protein
VRQGRPVTSAVDGASRSGTSVRVVVRPASDQERAGQSLAVRAAAAALVGGVLIAVVAFSFGPRFFLADVRALGIGLGVLAAALAIGPLVSGRSGSSVGPLLIAVGVLAFPVAAGGLVVGSVLVGGAGVVLASIQTAPDDAVAVLERGHLGRRVAAAMVDVGLTAIVVLLAAVTVLDDALAGSTGLVYLAWAAVWMLVTVPAALTVDASPGAWLLDVRLSTPGGSRPSRRGVVARQFLRGLLGVGGLLLVASVTVSRGLLPGLLLAGPVIAAVAASLRWPTGGRGCWLDALTATLPLTARVRPS